MKRKKFCLTVMFTAIMLLLCAAGSFCFAIEDVTVPQEHIHSFIEESKTPAGIGKAGEIIYVCHGCGEKKSETVAGIASVTLSDKTAGYTGKSLKVKVNVTDADGKALAENTDYTVSFSDNVKPGTAKATVLFKGRYAGTKTLYFKIVCTHQYGEWKIVRKATTKADGERTLTCEKCGYVHKAVIKQISSVSLANKSMKYTGKALKNKVTVKNSEGSALKNGTDYSVTYKNNVKFGTASVTVTFKGKYSGTVKKTFKITHEHKMGEWKPVKAATTKANGTKTRSCVCGYKQQGTVYAVKGVTLSKASAVYTGKSITVPVTVKNSKGQRLTKGKAYTVSYSGNKNVGTASVTVTLKGMYAGKITKKFNIVPQSTAFTKTAPGVKEMLVQWKKKTAQAGGYQIQYSTDKSFSNGVKTLTVKDKTKTSRMVYDLTARRTYYTRIRVFLKKNGKNYFSAWSSPVTVKTKTAGSHYIEGSVPESAAPSPSYFDDAVFIGDSVSLGLTYYEAANDRLGKAQFLTAGSLSATNALWSVSSSSVHPRYNGEKMKLEKSVPLTKAKKIYIMLGMNDISMGVDYSLGNFETLCDNIHKAAPDAVFYVQSVTPKANQGAKNFSSYLNNNNITLYNKKMSQLCREKGWYFINVAETMFDSAGFLKRSYCSDPDGMGMHFMPDGCAAWVDYLYRHTA